MRKIFQKILQILDGTPTVYGESQKGQSIVEMTVITPLLIILIIGIIEIGWLANNYLTLQEVAKVGARRATVLPADLGPLAWERDSALRNASYLPSLFTDGITVDPNGSTYPTVEEQDAWNRGDFDRRIIREEQGCNDQSLLTNSASGGTGNIYRSFYNETMVPHSRFNRPTYL